MKFNRFIFWIFLLSFEAQAQSPPFHFVSSFSQKIAPLEGEPAPCQSESFDTRSLTPKNKVSYETKLISGLKLQIYSFECASSQSFILELTGGPKKRLFTHVGRFRVGQGRYLYLVNSVKKTQGWENLVRIIDLKTNSESKLPLTEACVDTGVDKGDGFWSQGNLITYQGMGRGDQSFFCIWDKKGKMVSRFESELPWLANGNDSIFSSSFGLLPREPSVLYFLAKPEGVNLHGCFLWLQNIRGPHSIKKVPLTRESLRIMWSVQGACLADDAFSDSIEIDFKNLTFSSKTVRFRLHRYPSSLAGPLPDTFVNKPLLGNWEEVGVP